MSFLRFPVMQSDNGNFSATKKRLSEEFWKSSAASCWSVERYKPKAKTPSIARMLGAFVYSKIKMTGSNTPTVVARVQVSPSRTKSTGE